MKTAILGCGAIGGLFLGYLHKAQVDVTGVVRPYQKEALDKNGLTIEGPAGKQKVEVKTLTRLEEKADLAVLAGKIDDLKELVENNLSYLRDAVIVTTQNGVFADGLLKEYFAPEKILTAIVMFGATYYPPDRIVHNFPGDLVVGNMFGFSMDVFAQAAGTLSKAFKVTPSANIKGAKYLKVFVNLNNALAALTGLSLQETYADRDLARLAIRLNREAFKAVQDAGIELESLPNYPRERLRGLVTTDIEEATGLFSNIMRALSKEPLYGSILQSIKRGKKSEIDYINGEIVRLANNNGAAAPLNAKVVELVHRVEAAAGFLSKEEILNNMAQGLPEVRAR